MSTPSFNPIEIQCNSCGAATHFNIIEQSYHCEYCGNNTLAKIAKEEKQKWIEQEQAKSLQTLEEDSPSIEHFICPSCGADILSEKGSASATCSFCHSKVVSNQILQEDQLPVSIIPFYLTKEEAKERIKEWIETHKNSKEANVLRSNMHKLEGFYLPYRIYQGPVDLEVTRDGTYRTYHLKSHLTAKAVNASKQLDNEVLDRAEPFDFTSLQSFNFGYIAGQKIKLQDVNDALMQQRMNTEIEHDSEQLLHTSLKSSGCHTHIQTQECLYIPALLPMYYMNCSSKVKAAINGQTGRISVSKKKKAKDRSWMIEPSILTLLTSLILFFLSGRDIKTLIGSFTVFALIYFSLYSQVKSLSLRRKFFQSKESLAQRNADKNIEYKDVNSPTFGEEQFAKPVFMEKISGVDTPVSIHFFSAPRILGAAILFLLLNFLPYVLVLISSGASILLGKGEGLLFNDSISTGLGWLVLSFPLSMILGLKFLRISIFEKPIFTLLQGNNPKRVHSDYDLSQKKNRSSLKEILSMILTPPSLWGTIGILFLLLGFTLAMIF